MAPVDLTIRGRVIVTFVAVVVLLAALAINLANEQRYPDVHYCIWDRGVLDFYDEVVRLESLVAGPPDRGPMYAHPREERLRVQAPGL